VAILALLGRRLLRRKAIRASSPAEPLSAPPSPPEPDAGGPAASSGLEIDDKRSPAPGEAAGSEVELGNTEKDGQRVASVDARSTPGEASSGHGRNSWLMRLAIVLSVLLIAVSIAAGMCGAGMCRSDPEPQCDRQPAVEVDSVQAVFAGPDDPSWLASTSGVCSNLDYFLNQTHIAFNYYPRTMVTFAEAPSRLANAIEGDLAMEATLVSSIWDDKNIALTDMSAGISVFKVDEHRMCSTDETERRPCVRFTGQLSADPSNGVINEGDCQLFVDPSWQSPCLPTDSALTCITSASIPVFNGDANLCDLGIGYDPFTGCDGGTPIDSTTLKSNSSATGGTVSSFIKVIDSENTQKTQISASASASASGYGYSGSFSSDYFSSSSFSSSSGGVYKIGSDTGARSKKISNWPTLRLTPAARADFLEGPDKWKNENYPSLFVEEVVLGGNFMGGYTFTSKDAGSSNAFEAAAKFSGSDWGVSGKASTAFSDAKQDYSETTSIQSFYRCSPGCNEAETSDSWDAINPGDILKVYNNWANTVLQCRTESNLCVVKSFRVAPIGSLQEIDELLSTDKGAIKWPQGKKGKAFQEIFTNFLPSQRFMQAWNDGSQKAWIQKGSLENWVSSVPSTCPQIHTTLKDHSNKIGMLWDKVPTRSASNLKKLENSPEWSINGTISSFADITNVYKQAVNDLLGLLGDRTPKMTEVGSRGQNFQGGYCSNDRNILCVIEGTSNPNAAICEQPAAGPQIHTSNDDEIECTKNCLDDRNCVYASLATNWGIDPPLCRHFNKAASPCKFQWTPFYWAYAKYKKQYELYGDQCATWFYGETVSPPLWLCTEANSASAAYRQHC